MRILCCFLLIAISSGVFADTKKTENKSVTLLPGDVISVTVINHEELSLDCKVGTGGAFFYPYCGFIAVKNKNVKELAKEISAGLAKSDINNTKVAVLVQQAQRNIYVLGEVNSPTEVKYQREMPITVLQAISAASGFTDMADIQKIKIVRHTGDSEKTFEFDAKTKIDQGKKISFFLQAGDTVIVKALQPVSVLGQVKNACVFYLKGDAETTVSMAIAMAGGFAKFADTDDVYMKRGTDIKNIDVNKILTTKADDPVLNPGDVIFVTKTRW